MEQENEGTAKELCIKACERDPALTMSNTEYLTLRDLRVQGTVTSPSRAAGGACQGMGSGISGRNESQIPGLATGWDLGDVI